MDIFGVGPGEIILILIIALVVVGPERLPVLARQAGKMLVSLRNWVQKSPDAAMVLRARQEIEAELANIRESLAEVQSARDELVQAAKQVNTLVNEEVIGATRESLDEVAHVGIPRATKPNGLPATPSAPAQVATPAEQAIEATPEPQVIAPDGTTLIEAAPVEATPTIAPPRVNGSDDMPKHDLVVLQAQVATLAEELRRLQALLQERGVIDPAPLVPAHVPLNGVHLAEPELPPTHHAAQPPTLEEPADVEQPAYSRD